jgi:hypothetical protein
MESRSFYDVRAQEMPSGIFDLRIVSAPVRTALVRLMKQQAAPLGLKEVILSEAGYATVPEPSYGISMPWAKAVFELQRSVEIATGRRVPMLAKAERVYAIHFAAFAPEHWQQLAELFSQLPEWRGAEPTPHWFGKPSGPPPYIWGRVEPLGLHITGVLSMARWAGWDTWLRRNVDMFPLSPPR